MMISTVTGHFDEFDASVETGRDDFVGARISFTAKTASINTKNSNRDAHLRSDDFFNAESYPELTFKGRAFDGRTLVGDLTIRDVTREVELAVDYNGTAVDPYGQTKAGFELTGSLNRKDYGLVWSAVTEAGSIVVGDQVKLVIAVQFIKS